MSAGSTSPVDPIGPPSNVPQDNIPGSGEAIDAGTSFVARLPDELLCEIFWFLDHAGRIFSTHVCRTWRQASLACSGQLWSDVQSQNCTPGVFAALMDRTRTVPVTVTVTISDGNVKEVASSLARHMHHCVMLSLHIKEDLSNDNETLLGDALYSEAPLLEKLIIMDIFSAVSGGCKDPGDMFACHAPRLSCVKLYARIGDYTDIPAFSSVRRLLYAPYEGLFDVHQYKLCLQVGPAIEDLSIQLRDGLFEDLSSSEFRLPTGLRSLSITPTGGFDPTLFLARVIHRSVPRLNVLFPDEPTIYLAERLMLQVTEGLHIVSMVVDAWEYDHLARIQLTSHQGQIRDLFDVPLCICAPIAASLKDLRITEVEWLRMNDWPPFPALTSLTLYLVTVVYVVDHKDYDSVLFAPRPATGVLFCPLLRTLTLSTRQRGDAALAGYDPALGPETVIDFIVYRIRFQQPKLSRLVMNGIRLIPNVVAQVAALLELVQDIEYGPGHSPPPDLPSEELLHWA
ncbi:hypothetical protein AURDEDRAFT_161547 [Auricularia subglabra TFB-10046 SS5]|nr:hypothetical protein AURDEDRAFT_161547 [Auricularia subglabra TFB-10046 SS5]